MGLIEAAAQTIGSAGAFRKEQEKVMSQNQPTTPAPTTPSAASAAAAAPAITSVAKSSGKVPKLQIQASYQALVSGLQSSYQPTDTFNISGATLTRDDVIARLNAFIATVEATKTARQQWLSAVQAEHAGLLDATPLRQSLHAIVQARLGGKDASGLVAFGFNPAKGSKRTVTSKATAVAKTASTREARHTMGKVQKKDVKGDVVGITVTPLIASPPTQGPSAPSTQTSSSTGPSVQGGSSAPAAPSGAPAASVPAATPSH
jgi:hypothetical protein